MFRKLWYTAIGLAALHAGYLRWKRVRLRSTRTTGLSKKPAVSAGVSPAGRQTLLVEPTTASSRSMPYTQDACLRWQSGFCLCPSGTCELHTLYGERQAGVRGVVSPDWSRCPNRPCVEAKGCCWLDCPMAAGGEGPSHEV